MKCVQQKPIKSSTSYTQHCHHWSNTTENTKTRFASCRSRSTDAPFIIYNGVYMETNEHPAHITK